MTKNKKKKPATKQIKRWAPFVLPPQIPFGVFKCGIDNTAYLSRLGKISSTWPHIEEFMMLVFSELVGTQNPSAPVRQIYRSIINAQTRIAIMRKTLEESPYNKEKSEEYDQLIREFASLNTERNKYVHGLWLEHENGDIYLSSFSTDELWLQKSRKITIEELDSVIKRMESLSIKINHTAKTASLRRHKNKAQTP